MGLGGPPEERGVCGGGGGGGGDGARLGAVEAGATVAEPLGALAVLVAAPVVPSPRSPCPQTARKMYAH